MPDDMWTDRHMAAIGDLSGTGQSGEIPVRFRTVRPFPSQGLTAPRNSTISPASGPMAEWLRRGLQILARRFDSGSGLHFPLFPK